MAAAASSFSLSFPGTRFFRESRGIRHTKLQLVVRATAGEETPLPAQPQAAPAESTSKLDILESRIRSRRRKKKVAKPMKEELPMETKKDWESMTLGEKAWELYVGKDGALNKINQYAFILVFVMVGVWIVFRFIGPALGFYQLQDSIVTTTIKST